jgi:hypothetical protein
MGVNRFRISLIFLANFSSLSPIRDCLSMLEAQMKDLHHSIIENHARRSKRWKYKLGFECLSCESRW